MKLILVKLIVRFIMIVIIKISSLSRYILKNSAIAAWGKSSKKDLRPTPESAANNFKMQASYKAVVIIHVILLVGCIIGGLIAFQGNIHTHFRSVHRVESE